MHDKVITNDFQIIVKAIRNDEIIAFPTGTVYGLAANALSETALNKLKNVKNRPREKTFTVFLNESYWNKYFLLTQTERSFLQKARNLPLTVLLKPKKTLSHLSRAGLVGLRIIDHPIMEELAMSVSYPLTATSANLAGQEACLTPACVRSKLPSVSLILHGGELKPSPSSTIIMFKDDKIVLLRQGGLSPKSLKNLLSKANPGRLD